METSPISPPSQAELECLKLVPSGMSQAQIAKTLKYNKSWVSKAFKRLKEKGLVRLEVRSSRNFWLVTAIGDKFLGGVVESFLGSFRHHNLEVVIPIVVKPARFEEGLMNKGFEVVKRRNYRGHQRQFNHGLVFMGRNVLYYPNEVWGESPEECLNKLVKQAQEVRVFLEELVPGLRLGYPDERGAFKLVNQHFALVGGPSEAFKRGTPSVRGARTAVDASKGVPEIEAHSARYAKEDMERLVGFFDRVVREEVLGEDEVGELRDQVGRMLESTAVTLSSHSRRLGELERQVTNP